MFFWIMSLKIIQQYNSLKIIYFIDIVLFKEKQCDCYRLVGYKICFCIYDINYDGDEKERDCFLVIFVI